MAETRRVYEMASYAQPGRAGRVLRCQARDALMVNTTAQIVVRM